MLSMYMFMVLFSFVLMLFSDSFLLLVLGFLMSIIFVLGGMVVWEGYFLGLVYLGGLLVLMVYIAGLLSKFNYKPLLWIFFMILSSGSLLFLTWVGGGDNLSFVWFVFDSFFLLLLVFFLLLLALFIIGFFLDSQSSFRIT